MEDKGERKEEVKAISIMYHDVVPKATHDSSGFPSADAALYKISPLAFDLHLQELSSSLSAPPIKAFDLVRTHPGSEGSTQLLPKNQDLPWMITFDDGGVSAYTEIADRLDKLGWPGHFLVTTDYIDTPPFVSRRQIRELADRGHVVGTHSCSHPLRMGSCNVLQLRREWTDSLKKVSDILGAEVKIGSIPGGQYSQSVAETAAEAGMKILFTSEPTTQCWQVNGCILFGRYTVQQWTSAQTVVALAQGQRVPCFRQAALWNAKKFTKALGGEYYLKVRKKLIRQNT
jgi:hypothetical protein